MSGRRARFGWWPWSREKRNARSDMKQPSEQERAVSFVMEQAKQRVANRPSGVEVSVDISSILSNRMIDPHDLYATIQDRAKKCGLTAWKCVNQKVYFYKL